MSEREHQRLPQISDYTQALRWLYDRIDYERVRPAAQSSPFRLDRIRQLLTLIGSPQERIPAVHIAGTKGKGSTAAMLESIIRTAGLRTGLFTSPHIICFEERMRVNGVLPQQERLTALVQELVHLLHEHRDVLHDRPPTFFEVTTLLAWMLFSREQVQLAVLETGLGGRLDCTNVCSPLLTIITSIGLDHTHLLGDTVELIAAEKAGILKPGIPLIQGILPPGAAQVVQTRALQTGCPSSISGRDFHVACREGDESFAVVTPRGTYSDLSIPLAGEHQLQNAALAVMAADLLSRSHIPEISEIIIRRGLAKTWWPLRFEIIAAEPQIILDAAHNADAVAAVVRTLRRHIITGGPRVLVFAASADKDTAAMLSILLPEFDAVILTRFLGNPRSMLPEQLAAMCVQIETGRKTFLMTADDPETAITAATRQAGREGTICVTGSIFLAAEVRGLLCGNTSPFAREGSVHVV